MELGSSSTESNSNSEIKKLFLASIPQDILTDIQFSIQHLRPFLVIIWTPLYQGFSQGSPLGGKLPHLLGKDPPRTKMRNPPVGGKPRFLCLLIFMSFDFIPF